MNILKEQYNKLNNSTKKYYIQQIQNATEILYNKHVNEYNKHPTQARYNKHVSAVRYNKNTTEIRYNKQATQALYNKLVSAVPYSTYAQCRI
jgi:hypothetical protein